MEQLQEQDTDSHPSYMILQRCKDGREIGGAENVCTISYEQIPLPCCRIDLSGFILDCNDLLANLFLGLSRADLIKESFLDLMDPQSCAAVSKLLASLTDSKEEGVVETIAWFKQKDGNTIFTTIKVKPLRNELGNITAFNIIIIDETFNYRKLERIEKDKLELEKKERLKDEFIAVASHELRTPIQPMLGFALLAKRKMISEEKAWDGILAEARRLQQLTNDILDVSRIESDTLKYEMRKEKINELLGQIVESMKSGLEKELPIVLAYSEANAELQVEIDRSRMTQVITNIIGNAIKFTAEGAITVESKAFPEKNLIEIMISDTGKGIPEDIKPRLFEKFATKGHGDGQNKGSGLGLYLSKAIVTAHGGQMSAFNNPKGGATFLISLPINHY